jgi:hypothetical protein
MLLYRGIPAAISGTIRILLVVCETLSVYDRRFCNAQALPLHYRVKALEGWRDSPIAKLRVFYQVCHNQNICAFGNTCDVRYC